MAEDDDDDGMTVDNRIGEVLRPGVESAVQWLTQFGGKDSFRCVPRFDDPNERWRELDVSTFEGIHDVSTMRKLIGLTGRNRRDRVRHFMVKDLLDNGFWVVLNTRRPPRHAGLYAPFRRPQTAEARAWWTEPGRVTLDEIAVYNLPRRER